MCFEVNHEFEGQRIESLMWFMVHCLQPKGQDSGLNQYFCVLPFAFSLSHPLPVDHEILRFAQDDRSDSYKPGVSGTFFYHDLNTPSRRTTHYSERHT